MPKCAHRSVPLVQTGGSLDHSRGTATLRRPIGQDREMEWLTDVGLGLENDTPRLDRTSQVWIDAGTRLRNDVVVLSAGSVIGVESKPIVTMRTFGTNFIERGSGFDSVTQLPLQPGQPSCCT